MDTIRALSHGIALSDDTITSLAITPDEIFIVCNSRGGVLFMLPPYGGGNTVNTVEISTSSKGVVQRMWQGLVSSR